MLHAILHGKAGRVTDELGVDRSWRELFRKREDLLTAVFFGRFRYLSVDGQREVLSLLVSDDLAYRLGPVEDVIFWPRLKGLVGRSHVEPDLILIFSEAVLLIEVKPPFGGDQNELQWRAQVESLLIQREMDEPLVDVPDEFHFLALGRNMSGSKDRCESLRLAFCQAGLKSVHTQQWSKVCHGVNALSDVSKGSDYAIYIDLIEAFKLFGMIENPLPFIDLIQQCQSHYHEGFRILQEFTKPKFIHSDIDVDWQSLVNMSKQINLKLEGM